MPAQENEIERAARYRPWSAQRALEDLEGLREEVLGEEAMARLFILG